MSENYPVAGSAGYEVFEHTADVGLRVWAADWAELCRQAGLGMLSLMVAVPADLPTERRAIPVRILAVDRDHVLHSWLKQLLNLFELDSLVPAELIVTAATETELVAEVRAEPFDRARHETDLEIKAVTWHEFSITDSPNGWRATLIFDI